MKKILIINLMLVFLISCGNVNKTNAQVPNDTNISATDESSHIDTLYSDWELETIDWVTPRNSLSIKNKMEYDSIASLMQNMTLDIVGDTIILNGKYKNLFKYKRQNANLLFNEPTGMNSAYVNMFVLEPILSFLESHNIQVTDNPADTTQKTLPYLDVYKNLTEGSGEIFDDYSYFHCLIGNECYVCLIYDKQLCAWFVNRSCQKAKEMEENGLLLPFNYLNYLEYEHSDYLTDIQGDDWDGKEDPRFINEDGKLKNDTIYRYYHGWKDLPAENVSKILRISFEKSEKELMNYALLKTDKKQFNVYILTENKIVKLITANNKPIDSLIVDNNHRYRDRSIDFKKRWNYNWREKTFTIFPNLEIVFYQNKFKGDKMIEHKPTAKYRIDDNGKFVKVEE